MTTIYWAGGEDSDMYQVGGGAVSTAVGVYRTTYSRCALGSGSGGSASPNVTYWLNWQGFATSPSTFWFSCRVGCGQVNPTNGQQFIKFIDGAGLARLVLKFNSATYPAPVLVQKVNTAGTLTTLTNTLTAWNWSPSNFVVLDKVDIQFINSASGTVNIYFNGILVYNFTGDTTTETTTIAQVALGCVNGANPMYWSEIMVADQDTRSWNLQTLAPVANGNTHDFDVGTPAAANVNEVTLSDATLDGSTTAGQIDQYTIPSIAAGTYTIMAIGVSARMQKGSSGPTKMDLGVRTAGTDYWSSDQVLTTAWTDYQNWWTVSPATSAVWTGLPTNIGLKSVT